MLRGYDSHEYFDETLDINGIKANVTIVPIGKPIFLKKKLLSIIDEYNFDDYDAIYVVSMASCITSLIDERHIPKVCMITPFYLYTKSVFNLLFTNLKDYFGCLILIMLNGRMGRFDNRLRVILAELDTVTYNTFYKKKFNNIEIVNGVNHSLGQYGALDIIRDDLYTKIK